jgi:CheY-like chemotaxis protein
LKTSADCPYGGEAVDGVDAIEKALQLKPDLILLDLAMPRMNGVVAATILKSLLPQVRIIAFTLHSAALGKHLASTAGFDAVLSKFDGIHSVKDCVQSVMAPQ